MQNIKCGGIKELIKEYKATNFLMSYCGNKFPDSLYKHQLRLIEKYVDSLSAEEQLLFEVKQIPDYLIQKLLKEEI